MKQHPPPGPEQEAPAPPRVANEVFGDRLPLARRFAELLAGDGVTQGVIGPRETPRLWERHLLNCAVVEVMLPHRTRVIDLGSGAGLPGIVLALARPDLELYLVEPMLRRTKWLSQVVDELGLGNVRILRGRAQDVRGQVRTPVVTARAVARTRELVEWAFPLLEPGGRLLALKGVSAEEELAEDRASFAPWPVDSAQVHRLGEDLLEEPTRVIEVVASSAALPGSPVRGRRGASRRAGR
ncbi:16S rRNA (guanine(527)-N(7))-methyltransferase RsmG [Ornithinicoccus halotolerans]|uniref:16S rRNA (guanine(527)-N(7))-methyltransferase RsmG n=1 Tax=Ornithinicoccus halotolerans TaxID=1748220 RepID=UPI00129737B2|nr:16S rRNA (guanine(527)-N(7))-methyltransferase RsmG [Ornithinicoccus halotolerans]